MARHGLASNRLLWIGMAGLLSGLLACTNSPASQPTAAAPIVRPAIPQPRVAAPQVATVQVNPTPGEATSTPRPTPTMVPAVAGLPTDGAAKGAATAKVTITEYTNPL